MNVGRPPIVVLCGSTRFRKEYEQAFRDQEHAGKICLTVPCYKSDPCCKTAADHANLDRLHIAKIDMADEMFIVNVGGYLGDSTRKEIAYGLSVGKPIFWLEPMHAFHPTGRKPTTAPSPTEADPDA